MIVKINKNGIISDTVQKFDGEKYLTPTDFGFDKATNIPETLSNVIDAQALAEAAALNAIEAKGDAIENVETLVEEAAVSIQEVVSDIKNETFAAQTLSETAALNAIEAKITAEAAKNTIEASINEVIEIGQTIQETADEIAAQAAEEATALAVNAKNLAETAAINALEAERNVQVRANEIVEEATSQAVNAKNLAETAAVNALEAERNVTETAENIVDRMNEIMSAEGEIRITAPHTLGDFYFSIISHMPDGVLPLNGSEVSRVTYSDLYNYVLNIHNELVASGKKFIVSEEEWQNISIENSGYVPYYSYGTTDGMFRLPRMSGYLKATGELDEAGNYIAEGLPNITGNTGINCGENANNCPSSGAFYHGGSATTLKGATYANLNSIIFNASRSNSIYGNSEHVTPETNTLFVGVWALTTFTQVGTANLAEIKEILSQCETILGDSLPLLSSRYDASGLETSAWKVGDGSWLDGRIYSDAYNKIVEKIAEGNSQFLEMKESELLSPIEFPESYLIDTENIKFRLPLFVVNERTIIKEWRNGTEWYRIWSNGYMEQGGRREAIGKDSSAILNFHLPFANTEYTFLESTQINSISSSNARSAVGFAEMTTTSIKLMQDTYADNGGIWTASGFISSVAMPPREEWEIDFNYYFKVSHGVDEGRINIEEKLTEFEETAYTRLDEVVEEVSKDYVVHVDKQVGELYFSFDNYCPDGVIPLDGRLVSRTTYADLWQWVQEKGLVKDDALITTNDENTVSIFNEDGTVRYCQWYGSGDGSLTFRMPKINGYLGATGDNSLAGQYVAEGLPNITGNYDRAPWEMEGWVEPTGAFYSSGDARETPNTAAFSTDRGLGFDASRSNSIYGNSEHVTPETNTLFVGVWAITASKAAVFDFSETAELLKQSESYLMNNVPLMSSRWDRDGLGNLGWVKADGSWIDGKTYTGAYNYCVEKLVSGHENFIDGQVAAISEENFDKFIVDRIGKRFRLPISNGQRTWEEVQGLNNPDWVLYFKLAHEFYAPAQASLNETIELVNSMAVKTDINLPTLSSRWDSDFAENIGWVKSEGQWLNGNVYRDAYELMVSRIGVNSKFVVATEGTVLTDENADKFLIDTAAVKFRLPVVNGERALVRTFKDSSKYYNYYSDGYLEQGGIVTGVTNWAFVTINLDRSYKDTSYTISTSGSSYSGSSYGDSGNLKSKTVNSFTHGFIINGGPNPSYLTTGFSNIPDISLYNCNNYLYFKLADEVPSTVVDTETLINDLAQEAIDFKNELQEKFDSGKFVIETYTSNNGLNWYRKWSDGFIEQSATLTITQTQTSATFLTPFTKVPQVIMTRISTRGDRSHDNETFARSITKTGFTYAVYTGNMSDLRYYAFGF